MSKKVSIKDIAKLTNTSITTVSFVLNGKGHISKEISKKILDTAKEIGYEPNRMAIGLRTGVSKVIGLVVENIGGPFFGEMSKVIEAEAEKSGYRIIYCSTDNNVQKGKDVIRMLTQQLVDGYIITPLKGLEEEVQKLMEQGKPVVLVDGYFPGLNIPHVLVDNYNSVDKAVHCFLEGGYKKIGFVTSDLDLVQLEERLMGYQGALRRNGIADDEALIFKVPYLAEKQEGIEQIKTFIKEHPEMDAILFNTNYLGVMGIISVKELGLRIPQDLAFISFDDTEIFSLYPPGITTIQQPVYQIAKYGIDLLLSQIKGNSADMKSATKLQIASNLIERGSTLAKNALNSDL
ncbi:LacI family DNA-binding transcriptional regulator [Pedobacter gandavensis]|uniref:LacI family DNA-binding transcriptional regulator n=1 Tax=Pedobacter gandavensis TaxID=2679963 RepID=A0ABR6EW48_9SPHI|nr:LacI family DNA-binding transcriptional regulator [Pedobacter gandavensis]MBB2149469.1 LacI family DNA-binding transcriptional regulator [Pedobacter gandavensis]